MRTRLAPLLVVLLVILAISASYKSTADSARLSVQTVSAADKSIPQIPLMVVANVGQWPFSASYQVWGGSMETMWLADDAIWIRTFISSDSDAHKGRSLSIKVAFPGANPHRMIEPLTPLDAKINYFGGADPAQWRMQAPVYAGARYVNLYPGIDLLIGSVDADKPFWMFQARENADVSVVRLSIDGVESTALEDDQLHLAVEGHELILPLPAANFSYAVNENMVYPMVDRRAEALDLATPAAALAEKPAALPHGTFLGGNDDLHDGVSMVEDRSGRAYVAGSIVSHGFSATAGVLDANLNNDDIDVFVLRMNAAGSALEYAAFLGGSGEDWGHAIDVDVDGRAFVTGTTRSSNFPTTAAAFGLNYNESGVCDPDKDESCLNAFVIRLDENGSSLENAAVLGMRNDDSGEIIAGNVAETAHTPGETAGNEGASNAAIASANDPTEKLASAVFDPAVRIDTGPNSQVSTDPSLAVDRQGKVHIVWTGARVRADSPDGVGLEVFYSRQLASGGFSTPVFITAPTGFHSRHPVVAVDSQGVAHIAFRRGDSQNSISWEDDIYYVNNRGGAFNAPVIIADGKMASGGYADLHEPAIAIGPNDVVHVAFLNSPPGDQKVMYVNNRSGQFGQAMAISGNIWLPRSFVMRLDSRGWPHFAVMGSPDILDDDQVYYVKPTGDPMVAPAFAAPINVSNWPDDASDLWPGFALDATNHVHLFWRDPFGMPFEGRGGLWYTNNVGGNFANPVRVDFGFAPHAAADPDGGVHLIYRSGDDIGYKNNRGGSFDEPKVIAAWARNVDWSVLMYGHQPFTIGPNRSIHLVYFNPEVDFHIYYVRGTYTTGNPTPTPTPTPPPAGAKTKSFQNGSAPTASYAGNTDSHIAEAQTATNYGTAATILVSGSEPTGTGKDMWALLKWDLSTISGWVQAATLTLNVTGHSSGQTYELYEALATWGESAVTWSSKPNKGTTVLGILAPTKTGSLAINLNTAGLSVLQKWLNTPGVNYGFYLLDTDVTKTLKFDSSEQTTVGLRPKLSVTYKAPTISRSPWVQSITSTGATVLWETDISGKGTVQYRKQGVTTWSSKSVLTTLVSGKWQAKAKLTGLTADTVHEYRVRASADSPWTGIATFKTAATTVTNEGENTESETLPEADEGANTESEILPEANDNSDIFFPLLRQ